MKKLIIAALLACAVAPLYAETVHLKDGSVIKGNIKRADADTVFLETRSGPLEIEKADIERIEYGMRSRGIAYEQTGSPKLSATEETSAGTSNATRQLEPGNVRRSAAPEVLFKVGYDFDGEYEVSNFKVCAGGCLALPDGSVDTTSGYSLSAEGFFYPSNANLGLGAGITWQTPRRQRDIAGDFYFVPMYGSLKLRTTPNQSGTYLYIAGQLGYNGFYGDSTYKGDGTELTGGLYAGLGIGFCANNFVIELLRTQNNGSVDQSVFDPDFLTFVDISADIQYTKTTLNIGYRFSTP